MTDFSTDTVSLVGVLSEITGETLNLTCYRLPDVLTATSDVPEIPSRFQRKVFNWVLYRAFSKQDAETYNPDKSSSHLVMFEGLQSQLGIGGDIGQIIVQLNTGKPHGSHGCYF